MALHGLEWQTPLARQLSVSPRTMRRWAAGTFTIPETVWPELAGLCRDASGSYSARSKELMQLARNLTDET
jgi:hypothetical protein